MSTKPIELIDRKTAEEAWDIAGRVEWTAADWQTFYWAVTRAFVTIAGRHVREQIDKAEAMTALANRMP